MNRAVYGVGGLALLGYVAHLILGKGVLGFVKKQAVDVAKDEVADKVRGKLKRKKQEA